MDSIGLTWFKESNLFHQSRINFYQTHTCSSLLLAFTMSLTTAVTVHVIAQKITDNTHVKHSELRDLRSEAIYLKKIYEFMVLKITLMPQIKEAFLWSNVNTKSTLQYPLEFWSDVSFIGAIFSRNWHLLFVIALLVSDLTFVFLLLSLLVSVQPDISKIYFSQHEWKQLFTQKVCY